MIIELERVDFVEHLRGINMKEAVVGQNPFLESLKADTESRLVSVVTQGVAHLVPFEKCGVMTPTVKAKQAEAAPAKEEKKKNGKRR